VKDHGSPRLSIMESWGLPGVTAAKVGSPTVKNLETLRSLVDG